MYTCTVAVLRRSTQSPPGLGIQDCWLGGHKRDPQAARNSSRCYGRLFIRRNLCRIHKTELQHNKMAVPDVYHQPHRCRHLPRRLWWSSVAGKRYALLLHADGHNAYTYLCHLVACQAFPGFCTLLYHVMSGVLHVVLHASERILPMWRILHTMAGDLSYVLSSWYKG